MAEEHGFGKLSKPVFRFSFHYIRRKGTTTISVVVVVVVVVVSAGSAAAATITTTPPTTTRLLLPIYHYSHSNSNRIYKGKGRSIQESRPQLNRQVLG